MTDYTQNYEALMKYIATLSEEERERHKELILETLQRDRTIAKHFQDTRENLSNLADQVQFIADASQRIGASLSKLTASIADIRDSRQIDAQAWLPSKPCMN